MVVPAVTSHAALRINSPSGSTLSPSSALFPILKCWNERYDLDAHFLGHKDEQALKMCTPRLSSCHGHLLLALCVLAADSGVLMQRTKQGQG